MIHLCFTFKQTYTSQVKELQRPVTKDEIKEEYLRAFKSPPKSSTKSQKRSAEVIDVDTDVEPEKKKMKVATGGGAGGSSMAKTMAVQLRKWAFEHQKTAMDMYKLADELDA